MKYIKYIVLLGLLAVVTVAFAFYSSSQQEVAPTRVIPLENQMADRTVQTVPSHSMSIEALRGGTYEGGQFTVEQELPNGTNYRQSVVSYKSEGLKIYGLLTIPTASKPEGGFPVVVFVHGYIPPTEYVTTKNYATYQAVLARNGFVTFKPDLRGHGKSEGEAVSAHFSEKYVVDTLYAISYVKMHESVNPARIGYWGHSNGGEIGLRVLVASKDVKAASLWAGVVGSYLDMFETYNAKIPFLKNRENPLVEQYGLPSANSEFWNTLEPYVHLKDIASAVQLQHGTADASVPVELSVRLKEEMEKAGKPVEYYEYAGDNHNISKNFGVAWQRAIDFFKQNLK